MSMWWYMEACCGAEPYLGIVAPLSALPPLSPVCPPPLAACGSFSRSSKRDETPQAKREAETKDSEAFWWSVLHESTGQQTNKPVGGPPRPPTPRDSTAGMVELEWIPPKAGDEAVQLADVRPLRPEPRPCVVPRAAGLIGASSRGLSARGPKVDHPEPQMLGTRRRFDLRPDLPLHRRARARCSPPCRSRSPWGRATTALARP